VTRPNRTSVNGLQNVATSSSQLSVYCEMGFRLLVVIIVV
jgi:hypothetical protein